MLKRLTDLEYQKIGVIKKLPRGQRSRLMGMGILTGKSLKMHSKQPIRGPVVFEVNGSLASVGHGLASKLILEVEE